MRWPHRPDDGGPRWPWRAEFGRGQARGAPRGLIWRELAGTLVGRMAGQRQTGRRQAGSGMARSRARAPLNWFFQGQRWGRCRVRRRAERVSRPAIEKKCRRRVLVVTTCSPRPSRAVQRAITCTASQAPLAAKRQGCELGVPRASWRIPVWASSRNGCWANQREYGPRSAGALSCLCTLPRHASISGLGLRMRGTRSSTRFHHPSS